jgi:hypothetical protein
MVSPKRVVCNFLVIFKLKILFYLLMRLDLHASLKILMVNEAGVSGFPGQRSCRDDTRKLTNLASALFTEIQFS